MYDVTSVSVDSKSSSLASDTAPSSSFEESGDTRSCFCSEGSRRGLLGDLKVLAGGERSDGALRPPFDMGLKDEEAGTLLLCESASEDAFCKKVRLFGALSERIGRGRE